MPKPDCRGSPLSRHTFRRRLHFDYPQAVSLNTGLGLCWRIRYHRFAESSGLCERLEHDVGHVDRWIIYVLRPEPPDEALVLK